jgi:DNA-binding transcriptional ArsR family regulator
VGLGEYWKLKRSADLIRTLLLKIEAIDPTTFDDCLEVDAEELASEIGEVTPEEVYYHLNLIRQRGLVTTPDQDREGGLYFWGLSWDGHDFTDAIRDDKVWKRTKGAFDDVGGWTFQLVKDLAAGYVRKQIEEKTGVKL